MKKEMKMKQQLTYSVLKDSSDLLTLGLPTDPDFQGFYDDMEAGNIGALDRLTKFGGLHGSGILHTHH